MQVSNKSKDREIDLIFIEVNERKEKKRLEHNFSQFISSYSKIGL